MRKGSVLGGVTGVRRLDASGIGSVVSLAILGDHGRPLGLGLEGVRGFEA